MLDWFDLPKIGAEMQRYLYSFSTSQQDDQPLRTQVADGEQEPIGGSYIRMQYDISPTTVTGYQCTETSKSCEEEHEIWDGKRIHDLETKLAKEIDGSKQLAEMLAIEEQMLQEKEAELINVKNIAYHQGQKLRDLSTANQMQSDEIRQAREELRHVIMKYQKTNQLLQERSAELSTAQQFLGKTDNISPTDVARLVEKLNAEIAQQSNFILDSLTYRKWTGPASDLEHVLIGLDDFLGSSLCNNLWRRMNDPDLEFDHLLTQLVLQTGLTKACESIINHWNPPFWDDGMIFDRVYDDIGRKAGQVVAGKWRALSSTHIDIDHRANKEYLREVLLKLIAAVSGPLQSGDSESLPPGIEGEVDNITRKALEIHEHVRSGLTSMDLKVYSIPCGTQFDASHMEDSNEPDRRTGKAENDNQHDNVICTLEMGLRYEQKVPSGKQGEFKDETGIILKSKVVLGDALADYES